MFLKPQDSVLALALAAHVAFEGKTYSERAHFLQMSASEVHAGEKRLIRAGLLNPETRELRRSALLEFLISGVPYAYATVPREFTRGVPTAWAAPVFKGQFAVDEQRLPVWAHPEGKSMGLAIEPLYRNVPIIALKDSRLYDLLSLVDALRIGRAREKKFAKAELEKLVLNHG